MEEITLEEFISHLGESFKSVFEFLEDESITRFVKSMVPILKEKGLTADSMLFDKDIKAQIDTIIDGNYDKLLAIETLLKGSEYLENYYGSLDIDEGMMEPGDPAPKKLNYYMIQYILSKKSNKNAQ
jgi:hypothetical protein